MKGDSQGFCTTTLTERFENLDCVCPTYPANCGPCRQFLAGANERCVYCDHSAACHAAVALPASLIPPPPVTIPAAKQNPKKDGRNFRYDASHARILVACRWFMRQGHYRPTVMEVAKLAKVSARSVFQHFPGMDQLYLKALEDADTAAAITTAVDGLSFNGLAYVAVFGILPPRL